MLNSVNLHKKFTPNATKSPKIHRKAVKMKTLFSYNDKDIYYDKDLILCLEKLGVKGGDILCVHSELFNFGTPLLPRNDYLNALLECFLAVLGSKGTLLMPTFTYSFCENLPYDKLNSKSTVGLLTEFFRKQKGVFRTDDPIFSFAVKGAKAKCFLKPCESCFDEHSAYGELSKNHGKILLFGHKELANSFAHFVEEKARVSYRYYKDFSGVFIDENGEKSTKTIKYFVRHLDKRSIISVPKLVELLEKTDNFRCEDFGGGQIALIDAHKFELDLLKVLKDDEGSMLYD